MKGGKAEGTLVITNLVLHAVNVLLVYLFRLFERLYNEESGEKSLS